MNKPAPAKPANLRLKRSSTPTLVPIIARIRAAPDLAALDKIIDATFQMQPAAKTKRAWDEAIKLRRLTLIKSDPAQ